ncbi:MAG TPA: 6-bladed beta-propeller [Terriglobales bacterium]|nr:6-bladed beta-propeller [Terriglobales bacterium]
MTAAMQARIRPLAGAVLLVAMLIAVAAPPARAGKNDKNGKAAPQATQPQIDTSLLVWPPKPEVARIKWEALLAGEDDLKPTEKKKKKASWMDRMAGVTLPQESGKPRLMKPYGVATDSNGQVYVADAGLGLVFVFNLEEKKVTYRGNNVLQAPSGVAIDDADRLFVADSQQHAVFIFRPDGSVEGTIGQDRLVRPVGIAIDNENRYLYVVDAQANRVSVFDADSMKFLRAWGKLSDEMAAPGTFSAPTNVAVDSDGNVYVTDTFNARVQVFDAEGQFVTMWGKQGNSAGNFMRPKGVAVDSDDHIYVVDSEFNNVQVFDRNGRVLMFFGDRGEGPGLFTLATGICVDKQNRIIVTEQWSGRMQVFRYVTDKEAAPEYQRLAKGEAEKAGTGKDQPKTDPGKNDDKPQPQAAAPVKDSVAAKAANPGAKQ